jgi:hypothetical protein
MGRVRLVEIGEPLFVNSEVGRVEAAWRAQRRREIRAALPRRLPAAVLVGLVVGFVAAGVAANAATVAAGNVAFWLTWVVVAALMVRGGIRRRLRPSKVILAPWRAWQAGNAGMVGGVRTGLGPEWTILWDRKIAGWKSPVALAVGPPGVHALFVVTPGSEVGRTQELSDAVGDLLPGWPVWAHTVAATTGMDWWRPFLTSLVIAPMALSPGDCRRAVDRLQESTSAELVEVPAPGGWPAGVGIGLPSGRSPARR